MSQIWKKNLITLFICLVIGGIVGVLYTLPVEFDFLNYRYYNGWAFLNNRIDIDVMPAMFRTYFNPILDAINYLLIEKLNNYPNIYLFISGLKFGIFLFLSYLIYDLVLVIQGFDRKFIILSAMILTIFSPIILLVSGYVHNDMQPAILVLLSLYIYLRIIFQESTPKNTLLLFLSALFLGLAVGLKYTQVTFGLSLILSIFIFHKKIHNPVKIFTVMLIGMASGFLITGGYWMWMLWTHFHNPFFPYFNEIFHSPMADDYSMFSVDFYHLRPKNLIEFIFAPLRNPIRGFIGCEAPYFDIKMQITFLSLIIYFGIMRIKKYANKYKNLPNIVKNDEFNLIISIMIIAYYTNHFLFGQIRYITVLFALSSLVIIILCNIFCRMFLQKNTTLNIYNISLILLLLFIQQYENLNTLGELKYAAYGILMCYIIFLFINIFLLKTNYISKNINQSISLIIIIFLITVRFVLWSDNSLDYKKIININDLSIPDNAVVICGTMATSYIVPKQNPKAKYYGFSVPLDYNLNEVSDKEYRNMHFKNYYLENELKKAFSEADDLYLILSAVVTSNTQQFNLYNKLIKYYSNDKIKRIKNCTTVQSNILPNWLPDSVSVCKLK